ncbi:MAG: pyrrolo-quinoline quinone [Verrucomicrobia bacterium]|nr:pyrrolo-quinoline quinone [Verrucomicrobiota bacterium]
MLDRLGLRLFAYDYRAEHVPTFDAELDALRRHGIQLLAWWFPGTLNDEARLVLDVLERHRVRGVQLWVSGGGDPTRTAAEQEARVAAEAARLKPIAVAAQPLDGWVALYNHGGWFGEPENQIAIVERLRAGGVTNVGLVYNLHHGHHHWDRFAKLLARMKPHLLALNLNGMVRDGDRSGRKILPLGQGDLDLEWLRIVRDSGWHGPIGILNHTEADAEARLRDNLEGLDWLLAQLEGRAAGPKPTPRTWTPPPATPTEAAVRPGAAKDPRYWAVEDPAEREKLPLYRVIPAATIEELTPANGFPTRATYRTWQRSHGDQGGTRFSALDQISRTNVARLEVAWTYRAQDGKANIQCNPIVVDDLLFTPTPGKSVVAVNATNGLERWRFKPEGRPAFRGLVHWPGTNNVPARLLFCAGQHLYALDPATGRPIPDFGAGGRTRLPGVAQGDFGAATACPAIFERIVVVPGFEKDVWGFDLVTGRHLWTFHTVPQPGEFGYDTWDRPQSYAANCWGGMALDEVRGIAYITTGSPKPNFVGVEHRGQNLFANCLIALDARTGRRLWHFQEIRHDIWDLDIPAPPNLATIARAGRRVDVVAACTKIGNTLLLDRVTGQPIFPFRLRRAPTSTVPGEATWPYQPDLELPEPFSKMEYTEADLTERSEEAADYALTRFRSMQHGWFEPCREGKATLFFGIDGGAEWTGACVDADTGRLYVSANHIGWTIALFRDDDPPDNPRDPKTPGQLVYEQACAQCHATNRVGIGMFPALRGLRHRMTAEAITNQVRLGKNAMPAHPDMSAADLDALVDFLLLRDRPLPPPGPEPERPRYGSNGYPKFYDHEGYPANKPPWGTLNCIDLNTGKLVWKVPLGEYPELTAEGMRLTGTENYGGPIVTAGGLVFCSGTRDHKLRAFDKDTGAELWSAKLPYVGNVPPTTYFARGRQYVVIAATGGNKLGTPYGDAWVAFALPPVAP